jgi:hypothetical protein
VYAQMTYPGPSTTAVPCTKSKFSTLCTSATTFTSSIPVTTCKELLHPKPSSSMTPKLNIRVPVSIALPGLTSACMNAQVNLKLGSQLQEEHMHKKGSGKGARELTVLRLARAPHASPKARMSKNSAVPNTGHETFPILWSATPALHKNPTRTQTLTAATLTLHPTSPAKSTQIAPRSASAHHAHCHNPTKNPSSPHNIVPVPPNSKPKAAMLDPAQ